jgi:hypothetical protein
MHSYSIYPPKPENPTGKFQIDYSYEKPVAFHRWQWSNTFNRWGAFVTFANGWHGFTFPHEPSKGLILVNI